MAGKTILITGASYGIGEAIAEIMADTGAHLLLVARTHEKLIAVQKKITERGGKADIFPCDLTKAEQIEELINKLPKNIDIVINNAGKSINRSIFDSLDRLHDFTRTMNLNYFAPIQLLLALIPDLVARKGQIINISAVNVLLLPFPKWAAYQASKTGFDQWFRSVAPELNRHSVATTSIYLPLVHTQMMEQTKSYKNMPAMQREEVAKIVCQAINTRKKRYAPYWLFLVELVSLVLRAPLELIIAKLFK